MPRPRRIKRIFFQPDVTYFKPIGIPLSHLRETVLSFDEIEAIRLIDSEGMGQTKASKKMKISQSTLSRLLKDGRRKIADAITKGYSIKIQGGNFKMVQPTERGQGLGRGMGRGRMGGFGTGPSGNCVCPKCEAEVSHQTGIPCYQQKCPKCGSPMTRE
ncbi:DUF134 domain-containing protein [Candidatus Pacearchaeota archaeon]|nr:DUF134 domain-containing protein [Candidatus Pacearchaeota archaeon]